MKRLLGSVVAIGALGWLSLRPQTWRAVFLGAAYTVGVAMQLYSLTWARQQQRLQGRPALFEGASVEALIDEIERDLQGGHGA